MRISEMNLKNNKKTEVSDLEKKTKYIEYPEEISEPKPDSKRILTDLLKDKELKERFFEGISYEKDPPASEE